MVNRRKWLKVGFILVAAVFLIATVMVAKIALGPQTELRQQTILRLYDLNCSFPFKTYRYPRPVKWLANGEQVPTAGQVARQRRAVSRGRLEVGSDMPSTVEVAPTDTRLPASPGSSPVRADYRCTLSRFWMMGQKNDALGCPRTNWKAVARGLVSPQIAEEAA